MKWLTAIGEIFGFLRVMNDADQLRKKYNLTIEKRSQKAIYYAEKIMEKVDWYLSGELSEDKFKKTYRWYKKQFNKYD